MEAHNLQPLRKRMSATRQAARVLRMERRNRAGHPKRVPIDIDGEGLRRVGSMAMPMLPFWLRRR